MSTDKARKLWTVNVIAFILLAILALTGTINWLLLPRGYQAGGALVSLRHFLRDVHAWSAVFFIISMLVHWSLHWSYLQNNLKRYKRQ